MSTQNVCVLYILCILGAGVGGGREKQRDRDGGGGGGHESRAVCQFHFNVIIKIHMKSLMTV